MRICHFITGSADSHYFESHARAACTAGHQMLLASLRDAPAPAWTAELPTVEYLALGASARSGYPAALLRFAARLRRAKVDVLQTHLFDATAVGVPAGRLARTPLVIAMRHHIDDMLLVGAHLHSRVDRSMAALADAIIVPSHAAREHLINVERHRPEKVEVINIGWDFSKLATTRLEGEQLRLSLGIPRSAFTIGCMARLYPNKGHVYLLESAAALRERIPELRVLLVGDGDRAFVDAHVQRLGLADHVVFAGYRRDVAACFASMDVLVHPSLSESFNQVIVEAMSVGIPVIATRVGGAAEVIEHGETGLMVPARDADAITTHVLRLYRDSEERRRMGEAGRALVTHRFTASRMTREQLECYERRLPRPPTAAVTRARDTVNHAAITDRA